MKFDESATKLSRNPLGIIALFILLIYGFATLLFGLINNNFSNGQKWCFTIFLVFFPVVVLFVFAYLVAKHHTKLYAPSDYKNEKYFMGVATESEEVFAQKIEAEVNEEYTPPSSIENVSELSHAEQEVMGNTKEEKISSNDENTTVESSEDKKQKIKEIIKEQRTKREKYTALALTYYEQRYDYKIRKHAVFNYCSRDIYFDGISYKNGYCYFFNVRYLSSNLVMDGILDTNLLNALYVRDKIKEREYFDDDDFKIKFIFIIEDKYEDERSEITKKIKGMIKNDLISYGVKILTVSEINQE